MKKLLAVLACTLAILADAFLGVAHAQITDINSAINKAGSLRYTAHRLAKVYIQIGMGVDTDRSRRVLDTAVPLYDRRLVELKNYAPTPEIRETYATLEKSWIGYKDLLVGAKPSQESARKIMQVSDEVAAIANKATGQLAAFSGATQGKLVNVSGRQRMLSQQMAKYYQAQAWGVAPASAAAEIAKSRAEFVEKLGELAAAPSNTKGIRDELELGKQQWTFFDAALSGRDDEKAVSCQNVATTSERILEVMDNVVGLYEKLGK